MINATDIFMGFGQFLSNSFILETALYTLTPCQSETYISIAAANHRWEHAKIPPAKAVHQENVGSREVRPVRKAF